MSSTAFRRRSSRNICAKPHRSRKNDLNSLLFLLTWREASKAGTLISGLRRLKSCMTTTRCWPTRSRILSAAAEALCRHAAARSLRRDAPLLQGAPMSARSRPAVHARAHAGDLDVAPRRRALLFRNDVDYLADRDRGRIATTPFVVYPLRIGTIVPGERLTERAKPMVDNLKMFDKPAQHVPGFDVDPGRLQEVDPWPIGLYTYSLPVVRGKKHPQCRG